MTLPFTAGQRLTAAGLNSLVPSIASKAVDQTVNNSTTFVNDDELRLAVEANTNYVFGALLIYSSGTTPDFKFQFTYPASLNMDYVVLCQVGGVFQPFYQTEVTVGIVDGTGANFTVLMQGQIQVGATAGNLQLQWAQNTANASNTIVRSGSYLSLQKVL